MTQVKHFIRMKRNTRQVAIRFPDALVEQIVAAQQPEENFSDTVRRLLDSGLASTPAQNVPKKHRRKQRGL